MTYSPRVADLAEAFDPAAIRRALETAYARGFQDGKDAFKKAVLSMDAAPVAEAMAESDGGAPAAEDDGKRAPRGLTRRTITAILKQKGAMKMPDLQRAAAAMDRRISTKTVYNELKRERDKLYREQNDLWSLIADQPVAAANVADWAEAFGFADEQPEGETV